MGTVVMYPISVRWVRAVGGATSHAIRWTGDEWVPMCGHVDDVRLYRVSRGRRRCRICERRIQEMVSYPTTSAMRSVCR